MSETIWVPLGYVARTHGVRGTLRIHWHDAVDAVVFPAYLALTLPNTALTVFEVARHRPQGDGSLIDLVDLVSLDAAQMWRGAQVAVPESSLPVPEAGEVYLYRLMGSACFDTTGAPLGTLSHIYSHGGAIVLGIVAPSGDERLLPLRDHTLRHSRPATQEAPATVTLQVPEGLWPL